MGAGSHGRDHEAEGARIVRDAGMESPEARLIESRNASQRPHRRTGASTLALGLRQPHQRRPLHQQQRPRRGLAEHLHGRAGEDARTNRVASFGSPLDVGRPPKHDTSTPDCLATTMAWMLPAGQKAPP
jgi:hypothetical protein